MKKGEKAYVAFAAIAAVVGATAYTIHSNHQQDSVAADELPKPIIKTHFNSDSVAPPQVSPIGIKDKTALYKEFEAVTDKNAKTIALLGLVLVIKQSKVMTNEDRTIFENYFGDKSAMPDGKKGIVSCIYDLKDVKSILVA